MTNLPSLPRQAAMEAIRRMRKIEAARDSLIDFACWTFPKYRIADHHRVICETLERVERGELKRVMFFLPPRHGKSEIVSKRFPAWFLGRNQNKQMISASYGQDLASDFGRDVRNIIADPKYRILFPNVLIAADSSAKNRWHTSFGGSYVAAGVGSAITGRGADILSIDDPLKDREEADSETIRDKVWDWYTSTAYTRLMPGGAVILTMTRWHEDDLAGRLLADMENGGEQWHVVKLPSLSKNGLALWPEAYNEETLDRIRTAIGERDFSALYQQEPRPASGSLFKIPAINVLPAAPAGGFVVRAWDLAATKQTGTRDPDWTVGVKLQRTNDGAYVVQDVVRLRGGPDEVKAAILNTAKQDGRGVRISIPQDPGQAGKSQVLWLTRELAGFVVDSNPETGDKSTRAAPVASQVNVGNLSVVQSPWNRPFLDELAGFPSATHDDQVDALSRAFSIVGLTAAPPRISQAFLDRI